MRKNISRRKKFLKYFLLLLLLTFSSEKVNASYHPSDVSGYVLYGYGATLSPADSTTYFFGSRYSFAPTTTNAICRIYVPKTGTITAAYIVQRNSTISTSEASTMSIRLNDTTDTAISAAVTFDATLTAFSKTDLSIAVVQGDYIEIKWATPAWATNPLSVNVNVTIFVQ